MIESVIINNSSLNFTFCVLQKSENKENREFDALRTVLYVVSPYNYEVILFLVKWLSLFSFTQEENEFVFKIETVCFLFLFQLVDFTRFMSGYSIKNSATSENNS